MGWAKITARRIVLTVMAVGLLLPPCGCAGGFLLLLQSDPAPFNFGVLDEGRAYRSAQPTAEELGWVIDTYGIKTVINLRGANPGEAWYDDEAAVCQAKGVTLRDHRMSAMSLPFPDVLEAIVQTLTTAEYPILIHCEGGADRSGAVSAIYRMLVLQQDRSTALAELTLLYFHFRSQTPCMDTLAEMYEPTSEWLEQYRENFDQLTCMP